MAAKFIVVLVALVASTHSSVLPLASADTDYTSFAYDVADPNTGDYKSQVETRVGGTVQGQYSLLDSDGTKRTVDYTADDVNGFNAVVRKDPIAVATPVVARAVAAPVISAPVVHAAAQVVASNHVVAAAPVVHSAQVLHSAPVVHSAPVIASRSVYAAGYPVYADSASVVAARYAQPSVISQVPVTRYADPYYSPLSYSAYSAPLSYW